VKRVAINGGAGRMGQIIAAGLRGLGRFEIVTLVDVHEPRELFEATYATSLADVDASTVDVVVDFSTPEGVVSSASWCAQHGVALVIGTTGLSSEQRAQVDVASTKVGVVIAANYSVGAVLSERFAAMAAPYFDVVEIIELHHDKKADAPSGTSLAASKAIVAARTAAGKGPISDPTTRHTLKGARGAEADGGIKIHSIRLPGLVAHQEILFGGPGEGLLIRHDSFDRVSFIQGVALAVDAVDATPRLIDGIDSLVG
jgi:4-hydroxy-tetrahydrodipicolinate reductase